METRDAAGIDRKKVYSIPLRRKVEQNTQREKTPPIRTVRLLFCARLVPGTKIGPMTSLNSFYLPTWRDCFSLNWAVKIVANINGENSLVEVWTAIDLATSPGFTLLLWSKIIVGLEWGQALFENMWTHVLQTEKRSPSRHVFVVRCWFGESLLKWRKRATVKPRQLFVLTYLSSSDKGVSLEGFAALCTKHAVLALA